MKSNFPNTKKVSNEEQYTHFQTIFTNQTFSKFDLPKRSEHFIPLPRPVILRQNSHSKCWLEESGDSSQVLIQL